MKVNRQALSYDMTPEPILAQDTVNHGAVTLALTTSRK